MNCNYGWRKNKWFLLKTMSASSGVVDHSFLRGRRDRLATADSVSHFVRFRIRNRGRRFVSVCPFLTCKEKEEMRRYRSQCVIYFVHEILQQKSDLFFCLLIYFTSVASWITYNAVVSTLTVVSIILLLPWCKSIYSLMNNTNDVYYGMYKWLKLIR